jgi:hypothetical protein
LYVAIVAKNLFKQRLVLFIEMAQCNLVSICRVFFLSIHRDCLGCSTCGSLDGRFILAEPNNSASPIVRDESQQRPEFEY